MGEKARDVMDTRLHTLRPQMTVAEAVAIIRRSSEESGRRVFGMLVVDDEEGKAADVTVVDLCGWPLQPAGHPAARIVHGATAGDVRHVVVDGRPVVVDGQLETANACELREKIRAAWEATSARMRPPE